MPNGEVEAVPLGPESDPASGKAVPSQNSEALDPKSIKLKQLDLYFRHLGQETALYWSRGQFFLVVNAALLTAVITLFKDFPKDTPTERDVVTRIAALMVVCLGGMLMSGIWLLVSMAGDHWTEYWNRKCEALEWQVFKESAIEAGRAKNGTDGQRTSYRSARLPLRLCCWVVSLFWGVALLGSEIWLYQHKHSIPIVMVLGIIACLPISAAVWLHRNWPDSWRKSPK